jgi:cold shock protein
MKGTIKWYNDMKGFGFISGEDGKEVFVHRTSIPTGTTLAEGDMVEYQIEDSDRGQRAKNLQKQQNV